MHAHEHVHVHGMHAAHAHVYGTLNAVGQHHPFEIGEGGLCICMYMHAHMHAHTYRHACTPPPLKDEDPTVLVRVLEQAHAGGYRVAAAKAAKSLSATEERANTLGNAWPIALHHLDPQTHPAEHSLAVSVLLSKLASGRLELSTAACTGASVPFSPFYALMRRCPLARHVRILRPPSDLRAPTSYLLPPTPGTSRRMSKW